jgi:hypothetical protein
MVQWISSDAETLENQEQVVCFIRDFDDRGRRWLFAAKVALIVADFGDQLLITVTGAGEDADPLVFGNILLA